MEHALDVLDLACEVIIAASIISILLALAYYGVSKNNAISENLQYYYDKDAYFDYNGSVIDGSTAVYLAETSGDVLVKVYTRECPAGFLPTDEIKDVRSEYYVDPAQDYLCNTIKDISDNTVALQIIEIGADIYTEDEEALADKISSVGKANDILTKNIKSMETYIETARRKGSDNVAIDVDAREAYKQYLFYNKMQEFYAKWRAAI